MKQIIISIGIILLLISSVNLLAQKNCKVLNPNIDSIYSGKCKKGLANGKGEAIGIDTYKGKFSKGLPNGRGTYTWANGDTYTGHWDDGARNGEGKLTLKLAENDSILDGLWENDKYLGPKPIRPKVLSKTSIDRYSFKKTGGPKQRVLISFLQNGNRNTSISNLLMSSSNGVETSFGNLVGYDMIDFPVKIKVNYETLTKLRAARIQAIFEFEITEPGDWKVEIHN